MRGWTSEIRAYLIENASTVFIYKGVNKVLMPDKH